jgi:hypothetical protein
MSLRSAIDQKCRDCIYDPQCGGGTWREQIAQCSVIGCPLWPVRTEPRSGPYANPPRDPLRVPAGWLGLTVGAAVSAAPTAVSTNPGDDGAPTAPEPSR